MMRIILAMIIIMITPSIYYPVLDNLDHLSSISYIMPSEHQICISQLRTNPGSTYTSRSSSRYINHASSNAYNEDNSSNDDNNDKAKHILPSTRYFISFKFHKLHNAFRTLDLYLSTPN